MYIRLEVLKVGLPSTPKKALLEHQHCYEALLFWLYHIFQGPHYMVLVLLSLQRTMFLNSSP